VPPRKNTSTPGPGWTALDDQTPIWELADILALNEALEATETALQGMSMELAERLNDVAIIDELTIELSTSTDEKYNFPFKVKQHPERTDEFLLEFE